MAPTPTNHNLAAATAPLFSNYYGVPFTIPQQAVVAYTAFSSSGDTFNVGIFSPVDWSVYSGGGRGARAWEARTNTSRAEGAVTLPAGSYTLGFYCTNLIQRCGVTYAIVANY